MVYVFFSGITGNQGFWRETRRFALRSMRDFGLGKQSLDERIKNEALSLAERFRGRNGHAFDPQDDLSKAVSNIICSIAFGKRYYCVFTNSEPLQNPFYQRIGGSRRGGR